MRTKIALFQINLFLFLSLTFLLVFYFESSLPDHFLNISSEQEGNFFSYYLTSFFTSLAYYTGAWVLFVASYGVIVYLGIFRKRDYVSDYYLIPLFSMVFLVLSYLLFPQLVGRGLSYHIQLWGIDPYLYLLIAVGCPLILFLTIPRWCVNSLRVTGETILSGIKGIWALCKRKGRIEEPQVLVSGPVIEEISEVEFDEFVGPGEQLDLIPSEELQGKQEKTLVDEPVKRTNKLSVKIGAKELINTIRPNKKGANQTPKDSYFDELKEKIEEKLAEFKIQALVVNVLKGPVVDTFELELGSGVKVSKVISITEDLSLALCGVPLRIVYPLEGRSTLGIEVPRNPREIIYLDEVLSRKEYLQNNCELPICLGKDTFGETSCLNCRGHGCWEISILKYSFSFATCEALP
jgi:hypothetical protein